MSSEQKPKSSASNLLAKSKTEFARLKQQAMVKLGKAESTVDIPHAQEIERFNKTYSLLQKIDKDTIRMLELVKELSVIQNTIADDIYELYDSSSDLYNGALKFQDVSKQFDQARVQLETQLKSEFQEPLSKHIGYFRELRERLKEEEIRKIDMERYARELKSYQEKAKTEKANLYASKHDAAKANYLNLHSELEKDLPALYEDRVKFFNPAFATVVTGISEYYRSCAKSASEAVSVVGHVNRSSIHNHPRVTTPTEVSAATNKTAVPSANSGSSNALPSPRGPPSSTSEHSSAPSSSGPPQKSLPVPRPPTQNHTRAKAQFDFNPTEANELGFKVGDIINILQMKGEWWEGELNGRKGLLPSNYVKLIQ